ncbi:6-carboxytetrahydropterin synthase QueD [bacterium]|nr:MAG: 6-carboxytetrahydropterin synthase QueD [bacterium]
MYTLKVELNFSAAHNLRGYKGKCEELHGHNWRVVVKVTQDKLDKAGMVMDFADLKKGLNRVLDKLDHKYLNSLAYFKRVNPTSENIAKYIYDSLESSVKGLKSITVWENSSSSATYQK